MGKFDLSLSLFGPELQTMESLQKYLRGSEPSRRAKLKALPRLVCADGFALSVQASDFHHCEPRMQDGPYSSVECAFPSAPCSDLLPYQVQEDGIPPERSLYNYVPVEVVLKVINNHGGIII